MFFFIKDHELLMKHSESWGKANNSIEKGFESKPVYYEKYFKTKIKSDEHKINRNVHYNEMLKENPHCICLSVILIYCVFKMDKSYYRLIFLEERRYIFKEKIKSEYINHNLEIYFDDFHEENSEEEANL